MFLYCNGWKEFNSRKLQVAESKRLTGFKVSIMQMEWKVQIQTSLFQFFHDWYDSLPTCAATYL